MSKKNKKDPVKELALEIDILDHMLAALVDILEKKDILTSEEWEKEVKAKIETQPKPQKASGKSNFETLIIIVQ
jgi:hypothetical protein